LFGLAQADAIFSSETMGIPFEAIRVLVVDDNIDGASMICTLLELSGYQAHAAFDGNEALAMAPSLCPHLVFLDLSMPGLSGIEVARELKASLPQPFRLVALSALGDPATRARTSAAGFDAHLLKPAHTDELLREIRVFVDSAAFAQATLRQQG
jgi:CheY-like chemotaxis protein